MRIYIDENLSEHVASALNLLCRGHFSDIQVLSTKIAIAPGAPDEVIIPTIGAAEGTLITRDFNIKRTRAQFQLCQQSRVGVIFLNLPKDSSRHWDMVKMLIVYWERIVEAVHTNERPFALRATNRTIGEMD